MFQIDKTDRSQPVQDGFFVAVKGVTFDGKTVRYVTTAALDRLNGQQTPDLFVGAKDSDGDGFMYVLTNGLWLMTNEVGSLTLMTPEDY